jgi:hypothetical protein
MAYVIAFSFGMDTNTRTRENNESMKVRHPRKIRPSIEYPSEKYITNMAIKREIVKYIIYYFKLK